MILLGRIRVEYTLFGGFYELHRLEFVIQNLLQAVHTLDCSSRIWPVQDDL